ncbi:ABC transporter ATP-binding protein [Reinekea sp.]|jgi:ATP-binding cassette subfamily B protein|uniref:ABC transporter ATP-binding protein n=1 Tax=Reinekea sp. TaxID=1970455 RepID=UPI0039895099
MNVTQNSTPIEKGAWKAVFDRCYQPQKKLFHRVIALALITAGVEASFTLITKEVFDEIVDQGADAQLIGYGLLFFSLLAVLVICIRSFIRLTGKLSMTLMYELRKESFEHLQTLSFSFFDNNAVGWLVSRITSDTARIARIVAWGTLDLFWGLPMILAIFIVLFVLDARLGLIVLAMFPFLAAVAWFFNQKILDSSRELRKTNSRLTAVYNEGIAGVQTSKILVREQQNLHEFKSDTDKMYHLSMHNLLLTSAFFPFVNVFVSLAVGVALWLGGVDVLAGVLTLGTLVAFTTYARTLMDPMLEVSETLANLQRTTACVERVMGLLIVEPTIKDSDEVLALMNDAYQSEHHTLDGLENEIREVEFKDIQFSYKPDEPVLADFNLKVPAGSTVALVGPTGSGKSTVVSLLCRFYEPTQGQVLVNGVDYRERSLLWLQSNLGIVLQTPFLFTGTVRSNIRYGKLDASDAEVEAAAKAVNVHDIIMSMENGYETQVQEGGTNLSTGQKQLISFARAIIHDPQILVMDEATSSVDTQTEARLQKSLATVLKGRTSFIIAHRLSTIRNADVIVVIENGRLIEQGSHNDLLERKGHYFKLYQKQFQSEQEEALLNEVE